jgi:hypothetical protein
LVNCRANSQPASHCCCCCTTADVLLLRYYCCCTTAAVLLLRYYCCCTTAAVLLLRYYCCCTTAAVLLLLYYCCCTTAALLLLLYYCCGATAAVQLPCKLTACLTLVRPIERAALRGAVGRTAAGHLMPTDRPGGWDPSVESDRHKSANVWIWANYYTWSPLTRCSCALQQAHGNTAGSRPPTQCSLQ